MGTVDEFVNNFTVGARANLYKVQVDGLGQKLEFTCKTASLPGKTINPIEVKYLSNTIKLGGDATFDDWTITILADEGYEIRQALLQWQEDIKANPDATGMGDTYYFRTATVTQIKRDGGDDRGVGKIKLVNIWPTVVDPVELSFDSADTIAEYGVSFSLSHWELG